MLSVLSTIVDHGYPDDYLFARIRARRALLPRQWHPRAGEAEAAGAVADRQHASWPLLQKDLLWTFRQMNAGLRGIFQDFFIFMELQTILCCLRFQAAAMQERIGEELEDSLLAREIRDSLFYDRGVAATIRQIEGAIDPGLLSEDLLKATKENDLIKHFETSLYPRFLQLAISRDRHTDLAQFFRMQVDTRNLMLVAKHRRWSIDSPPPLVAGGLIALNRIFPATDLLNRNTAQKALIGSWASGLHFDSDPSLEIALLKRIGVILTRRARSGNGISQTLDYLWQRYLAARNSSLSTQADMLPMERLNEEFIQ